MLKEINKKYIKMTIVFAFAIIILLITLFIKNSLSELLENNTEINTSEELTYYLNVKYDGVDVSGNISTDSLTANIKSDVIEVEDKLPYGLTFKDFIIPNNAVLRSDLQTPCTGSIVGNTNSSSWDNNHKIYTSHGITYNKNTNTVSFKVKNLEAGCVLTVGIKTTTPDTIDDSETTHVENRRDFYNFASLKENEILKNSNNTHLYMGKNNITKYNVIYRYDSQNSLPIPPTNSYIAGSKVLVANDIKLDGYTFNGWTTNDVEVNDNSFIMPNKDVTFTGSFTKNSSYKVTYNIISDDKPINYIVPIEKEYLKGETVKIDSLEIGTIIDGYRFLGWNSSVELNDINSFIMPNDDVMITGSFEKATYKLEYKFYNNVLPPNSDNLLPLTKYYHANDEVTLDYLEDIPDGYEFLGWYSENKFNMPDENVTIYGEWKRILGSFSPNIELEINSQKTSFRPNDIVDYQITIENNENFPLRNIIIKSSNNLNFINNENYEIIDNNIVKINTLNANNNIIIYAKYKVKTTDHNTVTNKVELLGATADNNYQLLDKSYETTNTISIDPTITLCEEVSGFSANNIFQFYLSSENENYDTWISLNNGSCKTLYIKAGKYKIKQISLQEYELKEVKGDLDSDNKLFNIQNDSNYQITYVNKFKKKGYLHSFGRTVDKIVGGS